MKRLFRAKTGKIPLPIFFPDATRAVVKTLDSKDIKGTKTPGVLVNTYHLIKEPGKSLIRRFGGINAFMGWDGAVISDSGGFQVMSLAKKNSGKNAVSDRGVTFKEGQQKIFLTPEASIEFQMDLTTDLLVVLDDFTTVNDSYQEAKESVERTLNWAKRSKKRFLELVEKNKVVEEKRPYLIGVVQGGQYQDLRTKCLEGLVEIGFDGLGFGGWPITKEGNFDYETAKLIADLTPKNYLLYGLGIGKPEEILSLSLMGYHLFDCVLPTRDARHKRLYVFGEKTVEKINLTAKEKFYSYYTPTKEKHYRENLPVSTACDCLLCRSFTRAYLSHLFRIKEPTALRLSSIHNLRFYSLLMEKIRELLAGS